MRRFRLEASARADYGAVNEHTRQVMDAYAAGVNAWISAATAADCLPAEYALTGLAPEPWQPWDGLVVFKVRHILMGVFESKVLEGATGPRPGAGKGGGPGPRLPARPTANPAAGPSLPRPPG